MKVLVTNVKEAFSEDPTTGICLAFPLLIILAFILFSMAKGKQDKRVAHPPTYRSMFIFHSRSESQNTIDPFQI